MSDETPNADAIRAAHPERTGPISVTPMTAVEVVNRALQSWPYIDVSPGGHYDEEYQQLAEEIVFALTGVGLLGPALPQEDA